MLSLRHHLCESKWRNVPLSSFSFSLSHISAHSTYSYSPSLFFLSPSSPFSSSAPHPLPYSRHSPTKTHLGICHQFPEHLSLRINANDDFLISRLHSFPSRSFSTISQTEFSFSSSTSSSPPPPYSPSSPPSTSSSSSSPSSFSLPPLPPHLTSSFYWPQLKENPSSATALSHSLLVRSGFIRPLGSGFFSLLPLGFRVQKKIITVIEEELSRVECFRCDFPSLTPMGMWQKSGRSENLSNEIFKVNDRRDSTLLLLPTHEEIATALVTMDITSYRQLPVRLYQINKKFRDEIRPRHGLLRTREFLMKDLYTFDISYDKAMMTYEEIKKCYHKIFKRIGVNVVECDADSGNIGGNLSHEFHVVVKKGMQNNEKHSSGNPTPSDTAGEDTVVKCNKCDYSANMEKATYKLPSAHYDISPSPPLPTHSLPLSTQYFESLISSLSIRSDIRHKVEFILLKYDSDNPHNLKLKKREGHKKWLEKRGKLFTKAKKKGESPYDTWMDSGDYHVEENDLRPSGALIPLEDNQDLAMVYLATEREINPFLVREHVGATEVEILTQSKGLQLLEKYISAHHNGHPILPPPRIYIDSSIVPYMKNLDEIRFDEILEKQEKREEEREKRREAKGKGKVKIEELNMEMEGMGIKRESVMDEKGGISFKKLMEQVDMKLEGADGQKFVKKYESLVQIDSQGNISLGKSPQDQQLESAEELRRLTETTKQMTDDKENYEDLEEGEGDVDIADDPDDIIVGRERVKKHKGFVVMEDPIQAEFTMVHEGDNCPIHSKCGGTLSLYNGIEVGHTFYLGKKYSKPMGAMVQNSRGDSVHMDMGCYGIGISRLMAAVVEMEHDKDGIVWPMQIAPFRAAIVTIINNNKNNKSIENTAASSPLSSSSSPPSLSPSDPLVACHHLYEIFQSHPFFSNEVLIEDRFDISIGMRLKQLDLIGIPIIIVIGKAWEQSGKIEMTIRKTKEKKFVKLEEVVRTMEEAFEQQRIQ